MKMNGCYIEDGERILEKLCKDALPKKYGKDTEMLKKAEERLEEELDQIKNITRPDTFEGKRQFASFYLNFYYMITDCGLKKSQYHLGGTAASSIICYLLDISDTDPLDERNRLNNLFHVGFIGDKEPEILLYAADSTVKRMWNALKNKEYVEDVLVHNCRGVVFPKGETVDVSEALKDDQDYIDDFEFFEKHNLISFDMYTIIESNMQLLLDRLCEKTGYYPSEDDINDERLIRLLYSAHAGDIAKDSVHCDRLACIEIFGDEIFRNVVTACKPKTLDEVIDVTCIAKSDGIWYENAEKPVKTGDWDWRQLIVCRENLHSKLLSKGVDKKYAFLITDNIRKGKLKSGRMPENQINIMRDCGLDEFFIEFCKKIDYLQLRANIIEATKTAMRLLYYKENYTEDFLEVYNVMSEHLYRG